MKRILVALDGSPRAPIVLAAATTLATELDSSLVLYRAISIPPDFPRTALAATDRPLEEFLVAHAREELERLARDLPAGRVLTSVVRFSTAWEGIVREATERDVDLIVIGAHGYGTVDRWLGTTAARVVDHADRTVLVVR